MSTIKANKSFILILGLTLLVSGVIIFLLLGSMGSSVDLEDLILPEREEAVAIDMQPICESHPLVKKFLRLNEGSTVTVGMDPGTYESMYTCVAETSKGVSVVFPFVRIK